MSYSLSQTSCLASGEPGSVEWASARAEDMAHLVKQLSWNRFLRCFSPTRIDILRLLLYNAFA
jgi:hypothetical protein